MDFELSADQSAVLKMVRQFALDHVAPRAKRTDEDEAFPKETLAEMAKLGLLGPLTPPEYGGAGLDYVTYCHIMEELARHCAATSVTYGVHTSIVTHPIMDAGNKEQKRRFLPPLASGERLGAFCLSEPGSGSDVGSMTTTAERHDDVYRINGTKAWITNGAHAGLYIVMAKTSTDSGTRGISAFVVERETPGVIVGAHVEKMGIRGSNTVEMHFNDCEVPAANRLGEENEGFKIAMRALDASRLGIASQAVGIARACLEDSLDYARRREQFGKAIGANEGVAFPIADMATEIEASRLMILRAADLKNKGRRFTKEASMAKLLATESAMRIAVKAVQVHGGTGYTTDAVVERYFRDVKVTQIYEGTSEVQRLVIARNLLGI
ncbi:MAG: acyl-CoA dehydrogenase family protein [Euryarchaeota archaeon]|nr:acyl-CoA dehydrogenase family protein [Euryarchaeota archaeon]